jgi:hypothetical protein
MRPMTFLFVLCVGVLGCREEPAIVIKFEPNDLAQAPKAATTVTDGGLAAAKPAPADAAAKPAEPTPAKKGPAECKTAADCVVEPAECCDCANGGKQHAIPKAHAAASKAERKKRCKDTMCTMMLSTDPTCGQRADCVAGSCVMAAKK